MTRTVPNTPGSTLRYALMPDSAGIEAIEATFAAYDRMMTDPGGRRAVGANLVALHDQAYEKIRAETGLPARLVTLGLRDRAGYASGSTARRIPLDDKLFSLKGPTTLTISTVNGRIWYRSVCPAILTGWESPFQAQLVSDGGAYEIRIAVKSKLVPPEEKTMVHEGILARMGRLIAAIASQTIDSAEEGNKVALVKQAIREIDAGADEARAALGKSRAEEFRLKSRQREMADEIAALTEKIRTGDGRRPRRSRARRRRTPDRSGIAGYGAGTRDRFHRTGNRRADQSPCRPCSALAAKPKSVSRISKRASHSTRRRRAAGHDPRSKAAGAERAIAAIARVTGVPSGQLPGDKDLDEFDRMHRDKEIAERLERIKSQQ